MRKLLNRKIVEQDGKCAICHNEFADCSDILRPTTSNRKAWVGLGKMTIPTMCRPYIGGAIFRKGREDYVLANPLTL
jgi:hypothetical protein